MRMSAANERGSKKCGPKRTRGDITCGGGNSRDAAAATITCPKICSVCVDDAGDWFVLTGFIPHVNVEQGRDTTHRPNNDRIKEWQNTDDDRIRTCALREEDISNVSR